MKQFCAECHKQTGEIPSVHDFETPPPISHGLCPACAETLYGKRVEPIRLGKLSGTADPFQSDGRPPSVG